MRSDRTMVETLIVGFGFSVIPLLRELESRNQPYTLISEGQPIWQQLAASKRLNFDLVSSFHASFYVPDQVASGIYENYYPTAREFYEYHERMFAQYRDKIVNDTVTSVENHENYSIVRTKRGGEYEAKNVVFSTGLGRPQNQTIKELDVGEIHDKTIVFSAIGDTTNMMVAQSLPNNNKVILLNNGFIVLDKYAVIETPGPKGSEWYIPIFGIRTGKKYHIDLAQVESHTVERLFPKFYKDLIAAPLGPPEPESWVAKLVLPHVFHVRFPETFRRKASRSTRAATAGLSNGLIGIKYWPIDMYEKRFDDELEDAVRRGVLLNDIVFFHTEGLVETWPKDKTTVDLDNQTIAHDGKIVHFDHFVEGGTEEPRLPPIEFVRHDGARHLYEYDYRDSYLGVVPAKLRNVFFIGYTRPFTGGLANMTEMQGLMVHKLLSTPELKASLYRDIDERVAKYNAYYYADHQPRTSTDHLVHFGSYTNDVAHFIGIERKLSDCVSWNPWKTFMNLRFELLHPNNALKFRMRGEYAVPGADALCRKVAAHYENWVLMMQLFLSSFWDKLLGFMCIIMLFVQYGLGPVLDPGAGGASLAMVPNLIAWGALCAGLAVFHYRNLHIANLLSYSMSVPLFGLKATLQPIAMIYIALHGSWYHCLLLFGLMSLVAFAFRQFHLPPLSGRYLFGDCKYKHKYRSFWARYLEVYRRVHASDGHATEEAP